MSNTASLDVGVEAEETAESDAPFDGGEGIGVTEDVFAVEVVHLVDLQSIVLLAHYCLISKATENQQIKENKIKSFKIK